MNSCVNRLLNPDIKRTIDEAVEILNFVLAKEPLTKDLLEDIEAVMCGTFRTLEYRYGQRVFGLIDAKAVAIGPAVRIQFLPREGLDELQKKEVEEFLGLDKVGLTVVL